MPNPIPSPLGGEADPNSWDFAAGHGPLPNPVGHTFPLLTHNAEGHWRLIGTGFYISCDGLFVTARHVIDEVFQRGHQISPLAIMHLRSDSGLFGAQDYDMRPIMQCWLGDRADIALGVAAHATNKLTGETLSHWSWPLAWSIRPVGTAAATYAFPLHAIAKADDGQTISFRPELYPGRVEDVGDCRDRVMMPFPYVQVGFRIHGGASGGPIAAAGGAVIGVNCTENAPDGPGFGAQIRCLQDAFIDDALLVGETVPRRITFAELVSAGVVTARDFVPGAIAHQSGHVVRLDAPISARGPRLQLTMAC